jgi:hypothetical protein
MKEEIKQDLKGMKNDILNEVREIVKMAVENMAKEMKAGSVEMEMGIREIIKNQMKPTSTDQSARLNGKQEVTLGAVEYTIKPKFSAQVELKAKPRIDLDEPKKTPSNHECAPKRKPSEDVPKTKTFNRCLSKTALFHNVCPPKIEVFGDVAKPKAYSSDEIVKESKRYSSDKIVEEPKRYSIHEIVEESKRYGSDKIVEESKRYSSDKIVEESKRYSSDEIVEKPKVYSSDQYQGTKTKKTKKKMEKRRMKSKKKANINPFNDEDVPM